MAIAFDEERARKFVNTLAHAYRERWGLFASVHHEMSCVSVQRRWTPPHVEVGTEAHAVWLVVVNFFDTMSVSAVVHGAFWRHMMESHFFECDSTQGWLFDARACTLGKKELYELFREIGLSFPHRRVELFSRFAEHFYGELEGDPHQLFRLGRSIDEIEAYRTERGKALGSHGKFLPGYGTKLLSLLAVYFFEFGFHKEMFPGAYPVDRHVQRQLIQSGVVVFDDGSDSVDAARHVAEMVRGRLVPLLKDVQVPVLDFSHAQWFLGNRLCQGCHSAIAQNKTAQLERFCPLWQYGMYHGMCKGGISTESYQKIGRWQNAPSRKENVENPQQLTLWSE
jgi:hypothetical protein